MKSICKTLGNIILFLGIIGSVFISNSFGKVLNYEHMKPERDWTLTIILFLSCALSVIVLSVILYGISEILERLEKIDSVTNLPSAPGTTQSDLKTKENTETIMNTSWKCPTCGQVNNNSNQKCSSCNMTRPSSTLFSHASKKDSAQNTWVCSNCGSINRNSMEICSSCGAVKD